MVRTRTLGRAAISGSSGVSEVAVDLIDVFTTMVGRYSDQPAIVHNGDILNYRELGTRARALSANLGRDPGVVGVLTARAPATVVGLLGILGAGGTYCPIDPTYPAARRDAMLAAAGCQTVIVTGTEPSLPAGVRVVRLRDLPATGATSWHTAVPETPAPAPEHPAYVLFTSGSTGDPKPVVTPREAITATVESLRDLFGLTTSDRVLQFASLNWDTCFEEILPTLTTGGCLVFDDDAYSGSFPRFLRMIERTGVTLLDLPTAYWQELVYHLTEDRISLPSCVRAVVIGGEAVSAARLAQWCELDTGRIRLINTYGCTETTLITHAVDLHGPLAPRFEGSWAAGEPVPIGSPLAHVSERISDEGELQIGGRALALGYLGLPEATESRFVTAPDGGRYFRTGDRVSRSADGLLIHQGRLDGEVKIRGIRVDPAEVEAHLVAHPDVSSAAVVGATLAGRTALIAYVVPRPGPAGGDTNLGAEVLAFLRDRVPGHLVPSRITVVPSLVYTASGKVDRARSHQRHAARDQVKEPVR